jgi:hypothetical protein
VNARGTRRPHPRRVRSKPVRTSRRSGAGSKSGCVLFIGAFVASPTLAAVAWMVTR